MHQNLSQCSLDTTVHVDIKDRGGTAINVQVVQNNHPVAISAIQTNRYAEPFSCSMNELHDQQMKEGLKSSTLMQPDLNAEQQIETTPTGFTSSSSSSSSSSSPSIIPTQPQQLHGHEHPDAIMSAPLHQATLWSSGLQLFASMLGFHASHPILPLAMNQRGAEPSANMKLATSLCSFAAAMTTMFTMHK